MVEVSAGLQGLYQGGTPVSKQVAGTSTPTLIG